MSVGETVRLKGDLSPYCVERVWPEAAVAKLVNGAAVRLVRVEEVEG